MNARNYKQAKNSACYIAELTAQLELLNELNKNKLIDNDKLNPQFEKDIKQNIKTALSIIFLDLELYTVKGSIDSVFADKFKPE